VTLQAEIAKAATDAAGFLLLDGNIRRYAQAEDSFGGSVESWIADPSGVKFRTFQLLPDQPGQTGLELRPQNDRIGLTYDIGITIHIKDRVLIGADNYEALSINEVGDWGLVNHAECVFVDQPYSVLVGGNTTVQPVHGLPEDSFDFFRAGPMVPGVGHSHRRIPGKWRVLYVAVSANTAPSGGTDTFDVLVNGNTIFTTVPKPFLAAGVTRSVSATPDIFTLNDSDDMKVSTVGIASTASSDVTVQVVAVPLT
jgi:hypothetical protein